MRMTTYTPPTAEIRFVLTRILDLPAYAALPGFEAVDRDFLDTILSEAGRFAAEVIHPLNARADREGCTRHSDGSVTTPSGFREAYAAYVESGWGTLALPEAYGGQGLPHVLATMNACPNIPPRLC